MGRDSRWRGCSLVVACKAKLRLRTGNNVFKHIGKGWWRWRWVNPFRLHSLISSICGFSLFDVMQSSLNFFHPRPPPNETTGQPVGSNDHLAKP